MSKMWLGLPRKIVPNLIDTAEPRSIPDLFRFPFLYRSIQYPSTFSNNPGLISNRRYPRRSSASLVSSSLFRDHDDDVYINLTSSCVVKDARLPRGLIILRAVISNFAEYVFVTNSLRWDGKKKMEKEVFRVDLRPDKRLTWRRGERMRLLVTLLL